MIREYFKTSSIIYINIYYIYKLFISPLCILQFHEPSITASTIKTNYLKHIHVLLLFTCSPLPQLFTELHGDPKTYYLGLSSTRMFDVGVRMDPPKSQEPNYSYFWLGDLGIAIPNSRSWKKFCSGVLERGMQELFSVCIQICIWFCQGQADPSTALYYMLGGGSRWLSSFTHSHNSASACRSQ